MIEKNISLKSYNTFGVEAKAAFFAIASTEKDLLEILRWYRLQEGLPLLVLGGGSNILFTKNFSGLVLKLNLKGKKIVYEDDESVHVEVMGGEVWHDFVKWSVENNWHGLENLALIPGNVGTAPIQNIGAYGVELKHNFVSLEATNIQTGKGEIFSHEECKFGYRDSVFKQGEKGKWVIVAVTFLFHKKTKLHLDYGSINDVLAKKEIFAPSVKDVMETVVEIRKSKLPDPLLIGNGGSFFKNPVIEESIFLTIQDHFPKMPYFVVKNKKEGLSEKFKIPAGWLIEQCGWKGKRFGNCGVHEKQALVLVNYGGARGAEILELAQDIRDSVEEKFGITLEIEVNII